MQPKESSNHKVAAETEPSGDGQFNLENILSELGNFGKYQILLLFLLTFRDSFLEMCNYNYVFAAAEVDYRCSVPECEYLDPQFNASWVPFVLNGTNTCQRRVPLEGPLTVFDESTNTIRTSEGDCSPARYKDNATMRCEQIVYENYNSVVAEFDLGCQPWKRTMIGTVHNLGLVLSYLLSGFVSDRYGRKVIIVCTPLVVGVIGLIKSFSVNYWMLLVFEFLETALGYGTASVVLTLESVSQKQRVVFSCILNSLTSFGNSFFGLIAWKIPYWRHMMRAIYAPLLVVVFYIFLVDEGVRWLLAHNKKDEAVRVLNRVAKINDVTLSQKAKEMMKRICDEKNRSDQVKEHPVQSMHLTVALRSKKILLRLALVSVIFLCCSFVNYGVIINSVSISGNKFMNFSALLLVDIPTRLISAVTLTRFGRKAPICIAYVLCSFFFVTSAFVPSSIGWASTLLYIIGKMCSSYGLFSLTVVALEVFPTTSRNTLSNTANTIGRLGAVLALQTPLLERYMSGLPSIVFGLGALGPAFLALLLPATEHTDLPDDISDAERLGDDQEQIQSDRKLSLRDEQWQSKSHSEKTDVESAR